MDDPDLPAGNPSGLKTKIKINRLCLTKVTLNSLQLKNLWPLVSRSNWNLEMLVFEETGKTRDPEKKPWQQG